MKEKSPKVSPEAYRAYVCQLLQCEYTWDPTGTTNLALEVSDIALFFAQKEAELV